MKRLTATATVVMVAIACSLLGLGFSYAAPPKDDYSGDPADVFADIAAKGNLTEVWRFDNASKSWSFYHPKFPPEKNTIATISRGDIVWLNVMARQEFEDHIVYDGWNIIVMEPVRVATSTPTAEALEGVIARDNLKSAWRFDNATKDWAFYMPRLVDDLGTVGRGDALWLNVAARQQFQGQTLYAGWNLIAIGGP